MQHLLLRRWIAVSITTLAILANYPAIAKPKPRLVANHIAEQVTTANDRSHRSAREILAHPNSKLVIQSNKIATPADCPDRKEFGDVVDKPRESGHN